MAGRAKENFPGGSLNYLFVYLKFFIFKCSYSRFNLLDKSVDIGPGGHHLVHPHGHMAYLVAEEISIFAGKTSALAPWTVVVWLTGHSVIWLDGCMGD